MVDDSHYGEGTRLNSIADFVQIKWENANERWYRKNWERKTL